MGWTSGRCRNWPVLGGLMIIMVLQVTAVRAELRILAVDEAPASFINADGQVEGLIIDVVKELQRRLGDTTPIQMLPEQRALMLASTTPDTLLLGFSRTPAREQLFHMITPVLRKSWVLYGRQGDSPEVANLRDLAAVHHIGVVRGDIREIYLRQQGLTNLDPVAEHQHNLRKLLGKRIDLMAYEPLGMAWLCRELQLPLTVVEPVLTLGESEVYIMLSRQGTSNERVLAWQQAAAAMQADGSVAAITALWRQRILNETGYDIGTDRLAEF